MEEQAVLKRVIEVVADMAQIDAEKLQEREPLKSYGIQSVDLLSVIVTLEDEYAIKFDPTGLKELTCRSLAEGVIRAGHGE